MTTTITLKCRSFESLKYARCCVVDPFEVTVRPGDEVTFKAEDTSALVFIEDYPTEQENPFFVPENGEFLIKVMDNAQKQRYDFVIECADCTSVCREDGGRPHMVVDPLDDPA